MDEVNVEPVDLGQELRQRVEPRLALAPVVFGSPMAGEGLSCRELHALRLVRHGFALGPAGRADSPAQFRKLRIRKTRPERTNRAFIGACLLSNFERRHDHPP